MLVDGMTAANDLGLSDAAPARVTIHTDSRRAPVTIESGAKSALGPHTTATAAMREPLARDYAAMVGMVFGDPPSLDGVLRGIAAVEQTINA